MKFHIKENKKEFKIRMKKNQTTKTKMSENILEN